MKINKLKTILENNETNIKIVGTLVLISFVIDSDKIEIFAINENGKVSPLSFNLRNQIDKFDYEERIKIFKSRKQTLTINNEVFKLKNMLEFDITGWGHLGEYESNSGINLTDSIRYETEITNRLNSLINREVSIEFNY